MKEDDSKSKIIQFTPFFPPHKGGLENYAQERADAWAGQGYGKILQVTFSPGQKISDGLYSANNYEVLVLPAFEIIHNYPIPKFWQKAFWDGLTSIKSFQGDTYITHTRFFLSTFLGGILAKIRKKQRIHVEHGSGHVQGLPLRKKFFADLYDRTVGLFSFRLADHIITISQANIPFIQKFTNKKVYLTYRGLNLPTQPKIIKNVVKPNFFALGFVGRITRLKGLNYLIDAMKILDEKGIDATLTVVGDGDAKDECEQQVKNNQLGQKVIFLGAKEHDRVLKTFYPSIDIFINPSLQEGLPTTVIEALASNCIVVATDVGGTKEISEDRDLIIVPPANSKDLAKAISKASKDLEMKGKSYQILKEKFSWERNCKVVKSIIDQIKKR